MAIKQLPDDGSLPNWREEAIRNRNLELRRAQIYSKLMTRAQRTSPARRMWFCFSEIADWCARVPDQPEIDLARRELAIDRLREAVLRGDFEDPKDSKSRLAFLHTSPHAALRFERSWAENRDRWKEWTSFRLSDWDAWTPSSAWPVTVWMRRADCASWFTGQQITAPETWDLTNSSIQDEDRFDLARSGAPGRPTSRSLVEEELNRRIRALPGEGRLGKTITEVAQSLSEWLRVNYPTLPCATPKTIQNALGKEIRPHVGSSRR
jgi:hypothetical protein